MLDFTTARTIVQKLGLKSRKDWEKYGNKLDGVSFHHGDLFVELERGIL